MKTFSMWINLHTYYKVILDSCSSHEQMWANKLLHRFMYKYSLGVTDFFHPVAFQGQRILTFTFFEYLHD